MACVWSQFPFFLDFFILYFPFFFSDLGEMPLTPPTEVAEVLYSLLQKATQHDAERSSEVTNGMVRGKSGSAHLIFMIFGGFFELSS